MHHGNVDKLLDMLCIEVTRHTLLCHRSILEKGFGDGLLLPDSDKFDCGMCVHASDVDFDGENELLLGTYGQVRAGNIRTGEG